MAQNELKENIQDDTIQNMFRSFNIAKEQDLKLLLEKIIRLLDKFDMQKISEELRGKELDVDFDLDTLKFFKKSFSEAYDIVENSQIDDFEMKIEATAILAEFFSFLKSALALPDNEYAKYKNTITFEFALFSHLYKGNFTKIFEQLKSKSS